MLHIRPNHLVLLDLVSLPDGAMLRRGWPAPSPPRISRRLVPPPPPRRFVPPVRANASNAPGRPRRRRGTGCATPPTRAASARRTWAELYINHDLERIRTGIEHCVSIRPHHHLHVLGLILRVVRTDNVECMNGLVV